MTFKTSIRRNIVVLLSLVLLGVVSMGEGDEVPSSDIVVADFELESYGDWKVEGTAFGNGPASGTLPNQMAVEGFANQRLVNSFHGGDDSTGSLTSPEFLIERKYMQFLIGGGKRVEDLALQLLVDGKIVRQATGPNDQSGGSERLGSDFWNIAEFNGRKAHIRIIDNAQGGWGHLNVDQIVQTDVKPKEMLKNPQRTFVVTSRFLHLPIKNGGTKRQVTLFIDGTAHVRNDIELADGEPDWWAPMDVHAWKGKSITLQVDMLREDSTALSSIVQNDELRDSETLYREPLRNQFHFSPRRGWNNDPNGMVYYRGEYHLFFQHNPYGWSWGNMHWGHAVSKDMVHWQELGDTLFPDAMGTMFSGGGVVDWKNTSGLGRDGDPPIVLFYTAAGNTFVQGIAHSTDGRTFTKYRQNPILQQITHGNRDPKVIWHEPTKKWIMVLYVELKGTHTIHFFTSTNLKDWTFVSKTDGFFECPEFFELSIDGDPARKKWVLMAASSEYQLGTFDGERFIPETPKLPGHRGRGFYAAQTFSDTPGGRRLLMGWFQTETKGMPFNQSMTIPLELALVGTPEGPRMTYAPAHELESLRTTKLRLESLSLRPETPNPLREQQAELVELRVEFEPGDAQEIVWNVRGATIKYDRGKQELTVNDHRAPAPLRNGKQRLIIYCDRAGLEVFASDGLCYMPLPFQPKFEDRSLSMASVGGTARILELEVHELRSAWTTE